MESASQVKKPTEKISMAIGTLSSLATICGSWVGHGPAADQQAEVQHGPGDLRMDEELAEDSNRMKPTNERPK